MTTIYFVRHAEPNYENHDDRSRELSPKGKRDTKLVTRFLSDKQVDAVLSSPYQRAVDTVRDFAERNGFQIQTIEDFREREIGAWVPDFSGFAKSQWADFDYRLPGGDSLCMVQQRNISALQQVLTEYAGRTVVIGSHGTALSTIINYYDPAFGYDEFEQIRTLMPWVVRFDFQDQNCVKIQYFNLFP